ncbi:alpha/beta fold hydrolase [Coleofasciculus sp. FACHB-1120]|uniref:alpha/beta fold hydrolase n=1 Tax=Coleofasciculus sp. FACHB-1120 TaxID=2692783 RepID=UPI0016822A73|nr:alpha/beta fold hydrolase [Coleofasciculus sp. FACHB-1120]
MTQHWQHRIGSQRDWVWRGWQTRYTYIRASQPTQKTTPVLLLHGFGTSIGHWRHNLAVLGQSHTVYALDMLGFGASRKAQADYKIDLWVEQVYDFWRTFIQQPVVLVGNSIGSLVCLAVAAAHPEMVKGFVMMSLPDPSIEEEAIPTWLRPVVAAIKGVVASPVILQNVFYLVRRPSFVRKWAAIAYANPNAVTDELVDILAGPAQDRGSAAAFGAILKAMTSAKFSPNVKTLLPNLNTPMLLIWGRQDKMIPLSVLARFRDINPKLHLVELDAGHCPHDECPDEVNQIILNWLETMAEDKANSSATPQKQLAVSD